VPKRTQSQRTGGQGEAFVAKTVVDMGFLWHPRLNDFGVDGEIEIVDRSGEVTGGVVAVQVKSTADRFSGEGDDSIPYTLKADNAEYWQRSSLPVILVCVSIRRQQAWWKCLNAAFADPKARSRRTVFFDKTSDRFDAAAASAVAASATPGSAALPLTCGSEVLTTNLLEVVRFAPTIQSAATNCQDRAEAWRLMEVQRDYEGGFMLSDGRVFSFSPLDTGPLAVLAKGDIQSFAVDDWAKSEDRDVLNRFLWLLNATLRAIHHEELEWHLKKKLLVYRGNAEFKATKVKGRSPGSRGKMFFSVYRGRDDVNKVRYCRHYAADLHFRRWDGGWYLEINPTYHFTIDGKRDSLYEAEYLSGIKRLERNRAVLALVNAWADFLASRQEATLLTPADDRIVFGKLATVEVDALIDERAWTIPPGDLLGDVAAWELGA
jgi:hypothetical protein